MTHQILENKACKRRQNDNSWRMIDFAMARSIEVSSIAFRHTSVHIQKWRLLDNFSVN